MTNIRPRSVQMPVGLADGTVVRIEKFEMIVLVYVRAWDESEIELKFEDAIGFRESLASELSDLVIAEPIGDFCDWCFGRAYELGHSGGESLFQFLDVEGVPSIEIVAKVVESRLSKPGEGG